MENTKSTPSPEPTSVAPTTIAQSQPPSPATTAPLNTRPNKRKLGSEDGSTNKRLQVQPLPDSAQVVSPESSEVNPHSQEEKQDHVALKETDTRHHHSPAQEPKQDQHAGAPGYSRDDNQDDQSTRQPHGREQSTGNRYHERENRAPSVARQSSTAELSKANLKLLQQEVSAFEDMDSEISSSGRKRAASRQTSSSDLQSGTTSRSKEPTPSHNFYRYNILRRARIQIHSRPPPPATLQPQLDLIFKREVTKERKREVQDMAKIKSEKFCDNLEGASREDDLVEVAHEALFSMHGDSTLIHCRKAGKALAEPRSGLYWTVPHIDHSSDWNSDLKPTPQQLLNLSALDRPPIGDAEDGDRTNKRQQSGRPFPSPNTSQSTMPPPAAVLPISPSTVEIQPSQDGAVKTPRPDFTCGFRNRTVTKALLDRGLNASVTKDLLEALQLDKRLCSNPTQHFFELRFPILVIEGKSYSTGKTLFEAENQAAVSGSSMLNLQRQLTRLQDSVNPILGEKKPPLAFSVCTQGPILELWVHHLELEDNITRYHMNIIAACHGSLCDDLERFLLKIDCLIEWYKHDYLEEIADQLFAIASHVAR
ncbi:MAG: hypothetical protein Q9192_001316 [Flavoplaca navasiana]